MKAIIRNLHVLAYAGGHTMWLYNAENHPLNHVMIPGFFDGFADMIRVGDQMVVRNDQGGGSVFVTKCDHTGVIVAPPVVLGGV
jgi:hypothetical protein